MLASLRSRVFAATALVAVLPIALALGFLTRRLARQAEDELQRGLEESSRLVEEYNRMRRDTGRERARLVADLPRLKAAVSTGHGPTVEDTARDYRAEVEADAFAVVGSDGAPLATFGLRSARAPAPGGLREAEGYAVDGDRLLETFEVPLLLGTEAPEILGRLTLGFALDDAVASRLHALTGSHVAVIFRERVFATSLPRPVDPAILAATGARGVARVDLGGGEWIAVARPLGDAEVGPVALVLRSREEALAPLRTLRAALGLAAVLAVGISLLLSWAVARTVTRPLAALTDAMKEVAATGDLTRKIGPGRRWDDEDARIVARTFNTLTDSIARFQKEAALRERLSALGRLSTVVAHEVRNPLMVIKGSVRTLRRKGVSPDDVGEAATDIDHEVARLDRIVGDVLDFARPLKVEVAATDLARVCQDAARAALDGEEGVDLSFALDPSLDRVVTDGERIRTVVVNLVANARDSVRARAGDEAGPAREDDKTVEVGGSRLGTDRVHLWIADRGVGIHPADLPHLFEPYFTTKRTGTGLGLAIARKVVEALGGTIRVDSREGVGARIEIDLPDGPPGASPPRPGTEAP